MQIQDVLSEADNFALVTCNEQKRLPSLRHQRPSPVPVISVTSARHQRHQRSSSSTPAPVTIHTRACLQRHQRPSPAPPAPVTSITSSCHRARQHTSSCPTPVTAFDRACARPPLHLNTFSRVPPSHPTLKHFPDSFLVSRG
ncbi:hypothetical protein CRG98_039766 [Punica granatum]|uniref:Uncharacterized protein n=1 Tax=Punica granatum TaxID=22663 RepID=A0A2I0I7S5_PUNGR|nr:hypothetical protein CRG98_039766 [Punica granatum]